MIRWIAFDDETADALRHHYSGSDPEVRWEQPLDFALSLDGSTVVVLPGQTAGRVVIAEFKRARPDSAAQCESLDPIAFEPSGFLGLSDTPVFRDDPEPAQPKKRWWIPRKPPRKAA